MINFAVFLEVNGGPRHECSWRNLAGRAAIDGECVETETVFYTMQEIILFGDFL